MGHRQILGDKTVREIVVIVGDVEGDGAGAGSSHFGVQSRGRGREGRERQAWQGQE